MAALIWSPFADKAQAKEVAKTLFDEGLIACANMIDIDSVFLWQSEVEEAAECGALFKTDAYLLDRAVARIEELLSRDASEPTWRRYRAVLRLEEAAALQAEGQLDRALAEAQQAHRVLDLGQGELAEMGRGDFNAGLHASRSFLVSGDVLAALGRRDEAHEAWRGALEISKARSAHPRHRAFWVQALGRLDRVDEARAALSVLAAHPELDPRYRRFLSSFVAAPD